MRIEELESISRKIRAEAVRMSHCGDSPHLGSQLSCIDLLVAAYFSALRIDPKMPPAPIEIVSSSARATPLPRSMPSLPKKDSSPAT